MTESGASTGELDPEAPAGVDEARSWIGAKLDEMDGTAIGRVESVLVDAADGAPTWVVARLGRFGRRVAIPVEFVAAGVGHVWVPYGRDAIKAALGIDPARGLSCGEERRLAALFEIPQGTGRSAALGDRSDDDPGSVPAG